MKWKLEGNIWVGTIAEVPIAYVTRLRVNVFAFTAISPDGVIADGMLTNVTVYKTIFDVEQTLRDLGWPERDLGHNLATI